MRKALFILVLTLYSFLSLELNVSLHYCKGVFTDLHLFSEIENCCAHGSNHEHATFECNCCSNESLYLTIDEEHLPSEKQNWSFITPITFVEPFFSSTNTESIDLTHFSPIGYNRPPPKIPIFKSVCSLIFYA